MKLRVPSPRRLLSRPIRLPTWGLSSPRPDAPRIYGFNAERDAVIRAVTDRVVATHADGGEGLEQLLNATAYGEVERLERQRDDEASVSLAFWHRIARQISRMSLGEKHVALERIVHRMTSDVAGSFDPRVYWVARRLVPAAIAGVMSPRTLVRGVADPGSFALDRVVALEGAIGELHNLARRGTIILVPTHSSNMDSLAIGESLSREGLPPVVYGAGKNLFTNPITSFFMHNLGAYRVDRRIRVPLYKDVLKAYSCVMIERGYHSLFFPGGTRSRSGLIEEHLKLGLAGTGVEAFARNAAAGRTRPVFFVPVTINYALVLEAESLIEDWLRRSGKERYVMETEDDEFGRLERWMAFFGRLASHDSGCVLRFGRPLDPFGNPVDELGRSLAPNGRVVDPVSYVRHRGRVVLDPSRDAAYTRELGHAIAAQFRRETVLMPTQVVAHLLFRRLVREAPGVDLYGRMRRRGETSIDREELVRELGTARDRLVDLEGEGRVRVSELLRVADPARLVDRCLGAWADYHERVVADGRGSAVVAEDPPLLLYYQNRVVPWAEALAGPEDLGAAREIANLRDP